MVNATPSYRALIKIHIGSSFLVPVYPDCPGKQAIKWVSVCVSVFFECVSVFFEYTSAKFNCSLLVMHQMPF